MRIKFDENSDFQKNLEKLAKKFPEKIKDQMEKACIVVESKAKENCPVDSTLLRNSLSHKAEITSRGKVTGVVFTNVEYAPYVHNGTGIYAKNGQGRKSPWGYVAPDGKYYFTSGQEPQPFLHDALRSERKKVLDGFKELLS